MTTPATVVTVSVRTEAEGRCPAFEDLLCIVDSFPSAYELLRQGVPDGIPPIASWQRETPIGHTEAERFSVATPHETYVVSRWSLTFPVAD